MTRWATSAKRRAGFTIVELLIVIVVIAILAAITIVAYNGIQARAENTKTTNAIQAYKKSVMQYGVDKGTYPDGAWCMGDQYPSLGGGTAGCRQTDNIIGNTYGAALRDTFKPYLGNVLPMPSTQVLYNSSSVGFTGGHYYGPNYSYTLNGSSVIALIYYINDTSCPVGPVYATAGNPNFTGSPVTRSGAISATASTCMILLSANP